jgi:hypothetical protein
VILNLEVPTDKNGRITAKPSAYNPSDEVKTRTQQVLREFGLADELHNKPYLEFNNLSLLDRQSLDQMSWNQFVSQQSEDPAQAWKSNAFRPIVRNKIIAMAAHVAASIIYPKIYAQNDNDEEDREAGKIMRDIMEWANDNSNGGQGYDRTFLFTVIGALVNPAAIIHTEYTERFRNIKEMADNGSWNVKKVLDEVMSGFQDSLVPVDELWIANPYEFDIQRQPYLIWRRVIDYTVAQQKYADNDIFNKYVTPGIQYLYVGEENTFYEQWDDALQGRLVEEVIYYNRTADLKLTFVNGVLLDDPDQPNPRKDKMYPFVKTGFELIDEGRFFYYKSLPFKTAPDEEVINTLYRMIIDGTFLQIMPPSVVIGSEEIGSPVIAPGVVTTLDNATGQASFQTINTNNNLSAGFNTLQKVESSVSESSTDSLVSGQEPSGNPTAYEVSRVEANARVMLGMFAKMIGFLVKDFGQLRVGDILQYMTVAQVMDLEDGDGVMKFRKFLLPEKNVEGKARTRQIEFDMEMPMEKQSKEEELAASYELYDKELETDENLEICKVNPTLFRKLKFKVRISPEAAMPKSDALTKAMQLEEYALAMANPLTDKEAVTRDLLLGSFEKTRDNTDKYMMKPQTSPVPNGEPIQNPAQQGKVKQPTAELPSQPPASLMRKLQ